VIGVAVSALVVGTVAREDGRGDVNFSPALGATAAGTGLEAAAVGDRVELASNGAMIAAAPGSGGVSICTVAAPADRVAGTIALFLQIK
jgi:hypothetical protein